MPKNVQTTLQLHSFHMLPRQCSKSFNLGFSSTWTKNFPMYKLDYHITLRVSWETCMQVRKQQLEPDMEQWTGSKLGKEYVKVVYCHPTYLTSVQSTSHEILSWMKHKLESRLLREISTICISDIWRRRRRMKKAGLKFNIQKLMNGKCGIWSYHFMENRRGNSGSSGTFCFGGLWKSLWMVKLMKWN